jgi:hypothetical protein
MHPWNNCLNMTLGSAVLCIAFLIAHPTNVMATDTIDPATQPHLKSWSNVIPAAKRFVVLADFNKEAVLDRETGLVWELAPASTLMLWRDATSYCVNKNVGGTRGWRLPSVVELASLINPSLSPPYVPGNIFSGIQASLYWSATQTALPATGVWRVDFGSGNVDIIDISQVYLVWCTRGPMNSSSYQ